MALRLPKLNQIETLWFGGKIYGYYKSTYLLFHFEKYKSKIQMNQEREI